MFTQSLGTNTNNNMNLTVSPNGTQISAGATTAFEITFDIIDTSINAGLTGENYSGFAIDILLSTAVVATETSYNGMTLAPTQADSSKYSVSASSATGDVVIPSFVKVGTTNYPVTEIADNAFESCSSLKTITIGTNGTHSS